MDDVARAELVDALRTSLYGLTGRDLAAGLDLSEGLEAAVRRAPYALVTHTAGHDPVFVYGNDTALGLFELDWDSFTSMPSRLSAEPDEQAERERLLQSVAERGYIADYRGVRISSTGRRFVIEDAVVWDVVDQHGSLRGQAALFDRWTVLGDTAQPPVEDWAGRHDLGWSDTAADLTAGGALAATVAAAEAIPHHDLHTTSGWTGDDATGAGVEAAPWTSAYAVAEPAVGEHAHHEPHAYAEPPAYAQQHAQPSYGEPQPEHVGSAEYSEYSGYAGATELAQQNTGLAVDDAELRVLDDRITVVDDPVTGEQSRERVRTFLTLGPRGTDAGLSVGYDVDAPPEVRPLTRDELDVVLDWAATEGWNPGLHDADALWAADPDALWGVEVDGVLVGCGSTVRRGSRLGGVGLLLVDPAHRSDGIGSLTFPFLVDGALSRLEPGAGLALDCPEKYQDFCERFGFQAVRSVARSTATATVGRRGPYAGQLRTLAQLPFEKIVSYDAQYAGGERPEFLRAWMTPPGGLGLGAYEGGRLIGMAVLRPARRGYRIGPFYADSPDIAEDLLVALFGTVAGEQVTLDVPLDSPDALALGIRHGFTVTGTAVHMHLGDVPDAPRERVYGESTLEYG